MPKELFAFKVDPEIKAKLEIEALRRRITQGTLIREALTEYLMTTSGVELDTKKREREINMARPLDLHDGVMFVSRVRTILTQQKAVIGGWRPLESGDYDHFIEQVESEKKVAETYEHKKWILAELDRLADELIRERLSLVKQSISVHETKEKYDAGGKK